VICIAAFSAAAFLAGPDQTLVIAHRGASGYRPEHTIEAYTLAIDQGADIVEPDLVMTKDGVLIARHENEIGATTDVAAKFPARKTTKDIDGTPVTGWFTEDFTYAEIRTLRARERLAFRSHAYDGRFVIPTFEDILELVEAKSRETGRSIGVYPETKHPAYFRNLQIPLEEKLVALLTSHHLDLHGSPVFIQSFEVSSLQRLRKLTKNRLVLLTSKGADVTADRLPAITRYADGIGVEKRLILPAAASGSVGPATSLIKDAHAAGLFVHVWTLRAEPDFLPAVYKGNLAAEAVQFQRLGVDGIFTDFPDLVAGALKSPKVAKVSIR
jgi:glycerophosphoryl diester phosphodiesterase